MGTKKHSFLSFWDTLSDKDKVALAAAALVGVKVLVRTAGRALTEAEKLLNTVGNKPGNSPTNSHHDQQGA